MACVRPVQTYTMLGTAASQSKSAAAADHGIEGFAVIVGHLLAGVAGVFCRDLRRQWTDWHAVGLPFRMAVT